MRILLALFSSFVLATHAMAQCGSQWQPVAGLQGLDGFPGVSTAWDPDGPGPQSARLVVAGSFTAAGQTLVNNIAAYDSGTGQWSAFGSGTNSTVNSLLAMPNGDLIAGGNFTHAGGVQVNYIARWNGSSWSAIGGGMDSYVSALAREANGNVVAGGGFLNAGGVPAAAIARWNGSSWSAIGSYFASGPLSVDAITILPNGNLIAGGFFAWIGGTFAGHIAMWNGSVWSPLGAGVVQGFGFPQIRSLVTMPNGDVLASGAFTQIGNVTTQPARWDGTSWSAVGGGISVGRMVVLPNGDVLATSRISSTDGAIVRWDGTSWTQLGGAFVSGGPATVAAMPNGSIWAGGLFTEVGGQHASNIAGWNGVGWFPLAVGGCNAPVNALARLPNGDVIAGGAFQYIGKVAANRVARYDGTTWSPLGTGTNGEVRLVASCPNGDIVIGGWFSVAGGVAVPGLARWNGSAWSAISGGPPSIDALAVAANGDVLVSGPVQVAGSMFPVQRTSRWNGTAWTDLGQPAQPSNSVRALLVAPNGDVFAAGSFAVIGGIASRVARWDGTAWNALGAGLDGEAAALLVTRNGDLVVCGQFTTAGGIAVAGVARWNGSAWSAMGTGGPGIQPSGMLELPNGDILVCSPGSLTRWDGSSWSTFGNFGNALIRALTLRPDGEVLAGGQISRVNGQVASHLARLAVACPATASPFGAACNSLVGAMQLTAEQLPWTNGGYRGICTGMSATGFGIGVFGLTSPGTALSTLHPAGGPGCSLWASEDLLTLLLPSNGTVVDQLVIPAAPALVGLSARHQVLQLEFNGLAIARISSSNGILLTIGTY